MDLLGSWGLGGGENQTIIRVLKAVGLVNNANEPTDQYTAFMREGIGPAALGAQVRQLYAPLFEASLEPHREPPDSLRNLFNIHSSGAPGTIDLQIQTFRALCDYASFAEAPAASATGTGVPATDSGARASGAPTEAPAVHIDLHIHLPENKTSREYQYIIQDIARFIYGRPEAGRSDTESGS